ncbi:MAG: hypothetical protein ACK476_02405 [Fluviicola sp.]|jgi:hypothetical protein
MNWGAYLGFFGLAMIKFLFAPFGGPLAKLTFIETYLSCVSGAIFCAIIFYFSAEFFMIRAHKKRKLLIQQAKEKGVELKRKKVFTKTNKAIVKMKRLGIVGICFYAPFFLSVPIGSIISAKFFGKDKRTFPLIVLGIGVNGLITTGLAYFIFN